ncbi:hypothetical protein V866_004148 [Kwoniella sp. B9012]
MDIYQTRSKRARSDSSSSSSSSGSSSSRGESTSTYQTPSPPPPKFHKGSSSPNEATKPFLCVLPPTCSQPGTSTSYSSQEELDRHQNTFHKWICHVPIRDREFASPDEQVPEGFIGGRMNKGKRMKECLKVFPDERLLEIHHTEVHDPITRKKKDNGQRIFECFLDPSQCGRKFKDPKKRRRHMVDKHHYPSNYFFGITNHGINAIVQEDGLAMSLIRPRRDTQPHKDTVTSQNDPNGHTPSTSLDNDHHSIARDDKAQEVDIDDLTSIMESSLTFIPRGVRRAAKAKEKVMEIEPGA